MQKTKKKSFDWYGMRQHFSIRKYHFGAASVLLGMSLALGAGAQAVQAEETVASSETTTTTVASTTDSSASSKAVVEDATVASSTETAVSTSETATTTSSTEASTTETVATATATSTERSATINYIVQYVLEDGTVVKADVNAATVNTTETTATATVVVSTDLPAGYELASGQTATVTQEVTEGAENVVTVKVVKKAESTTTTATTESKATETASSETTTSTETKATTTEAVAETVKTPATVEEAKVVLEQVTSEAEVLANESERLVAASDKENTALKAAATATKLTATEATAVLNDSTATLEAVNEQIDAVRTNVEALVLELRKFLGTDLIQIALTTTTDMNNSVGKPGYWIEEVTVTNKDTALTTASTSPAVSTLPDGYAVDPTTGRATYLVYTLSNSENGTDDAVADGTANGSFNNRMGTDYYITLSVDGVNTTGNVYARLVSKSTGLIEEISISEGTTGRFTTLDNLVANNQSLLRGFNFRIPLTKTTYTNAAGESSTLRETQILQGTQGNAKGQVVYAALTGDTGYYNDYSGPAPTYSPKQTTYYLVKETDKRIEEFLASYTQIADLSGDNFTIAGPATFDNYELIESPVIEKGTIASDYTKGTSIIRFWGDYLESKVQYITDSDGSSRFLNFVINPDHTDFLANYAKYKTMSQVDFQAEGESVLRINERIAIVNQLETDIATLNKSTTLTDAEKKAKIAELRATASAAVNTADDAFLLMFVSEEIAPKGYNENGDAITTEHSWEYTSTNYYFKDTKTNTISNKMGAATGVFSGYPNANWINSNGSYLQVVEADGKVITNTTTNTDMKFKNINLSMFNSNSINQNDQRYYYAEKGGLKVYYVDTKGTVIKDENYLMPHEATDTEYNTATETVKPKTITYDGEVYYYKEIDRISDNSLVPASKNTETEKRTIEKIDTETGVIVQDTLKELTYVYEKAGNVNVNYVDTDGNVISSKVIDVENGEPGSDYDTIVDNKPSTITAADGTVYHLVPAGDYNVGTVSDNNNLTTVGNGTATGIDDPTGTVESNVTKEITYVYQKAGSVNINYVDTDGNVLQPKLADVTNGVPGSDYDTAQTTTEKPSTITTADGKTYKLVPAGTYNVGTVSDSSNLTAAGNGTATGVDSETGAVEAGKTKEITYVYEEVKGNVIVNYITTDGKVIKQPVEDTPSSSTGTPYDTKDNKPTTITTEDGKTYRLVPSLTKGNETGDVVEGTTEVTYVYEEVKGDVVVEYYDTEGNLISGLSDKGEAVDTKEVDTVPSSPGTPYNTDEDHKPNTITTADGTVYYYKEVKDTSASTTGEVVEGTTTVQYVYEKAGNVNVNYVDTEGNVISPKVADETNEKAGTEYSTTDNKPSTITTADGKTYKLVPAGTYNVGTVSDSSNLTAAGNGTATGVDSETGAVEAGKTKEITYVYEEVKGNVIVNYITTDGKVIKQPVEDTPSSSTGTPYDTKDNKPTTITTEDGKTYRLVPSLTKGNETGDVVEGTTEVTYVYEEVKGDVVVEYYDTEGNLISGLSDKGEAVDTKEVDTVPSSPGTPYNTDEDHKPNTITTADGTVYYYKEVKDTSASTTGEVVEGTTTVQYVYEKAGNVNVNYVDTEGNVISPKVADETNEKAGTEYSTTDNKPSTITTADGKTYKLVPAGTYKVGLVGYNNNLTEAGNGTATGVDSVTGTVEAGKTKEITYVYQLVTGSVVARYVIDGTEVEIADDKTVKPADTPVDEVYGDTPPATIVKDGKTYELVRTRANEGDAPSNGTVVEGEQTITYEYKEVVETPVVKTGSVVARYVIDGTEVEIADDKTVKPADSPVDEVYGDTPPATIVKDGKTYELVRTRANEGDAPSNGTVVEGEQTITYEYKEVVETPVVKTGSVV
ncbi:YSIRK-type signal peptide-containing protein, partial [Streptococcus suis]|nr:YSIRK-type signal peptide-containing protein [Streptococcus suis]